MSNFLHSFSPHASWLSLLSLCGPNPKQCLSYLPHRHLWTLSTCYQYLWVSPRVVYVNFFFRRGWKEIYVRGAKAFRAFSMGNCSYFFLSREGWTPTPCVDHTGFILTSEENDTPSIILNWCLVKSKVWIWQRTSKWKWGKDRK